MDLELNNLKALCDERRIEIIKVLSEGELNVSQIAERCSVSRPTVSHHLQVLKRNRIVNSYRVGKEIFYSINTDALVDIARDLLNFTNQI
ncbi:MAG: ArsR/SmtB family transcription factor [Halanaerobiales bacterium]